MFRIIIILVRFGELQNVLIAAPQIEKDTGLDMVFIRLMIKFLSEAHFSPSSSWKSSSEMLETSSGKPNCWKVFALGTHLKLTPSTTQRFLSGANQILQLIPSKYKDNGITAEQLLRLCVIVNTNSHALKDMNASGIFPLSAMVEHSCTANSNFISIGTKLRLHAISRILKEEAITLCYTPFYSPTSARQHHLQQNYDFTCTCAMCTSAPDRCRAFICRNEQCKSGIVSPVGIGISWKCEKCRSAPTDLNIAMFLQAEEILKEIEPVAGTDCFVPFKVLKVPLVNVKKVLSEGVFHASHHFLFWAMDSQVEKLAIDQRFEEASEFLSMLISSMDMVCQPYHQQKATYYDLLGQVFLMIDRNKPSLEQKEKRSKQNFQKAYLYRLISCGAEAPVTIQAKRKSSKPSLDM